MGFLNRPAIKEQAKNFISCENKWWKMILATFVIYLLNDSVNIGYRIYGIFSDYGIQYYNDIYNNTSETSTVGTGTSIIAILLIPFTTAIAGYYLNHLRGFNPDWRSLYKEGFDNYGKYFVVVLVRNIVIGLWALLLIVPGIVKGYAYSLVEYIIHDNPTLSASEARKMSDIMTQGHKGDLFVRDLSFLPWYLLMGITCGIAGIYVLPYVNVTNAMYYENLKKNAIDNGLIAPEAFGINTNGFASGMGNDAAPFVPNYNDLNGQNDNYNAQQYNYNYAPQPFNNPEPQHSTEQQPQEQEQEQEQTVEDVSENISGVASEPYANESEMKETAPCSENSEDAETDKPSEKSDGE